MSFLRWPSIENSYHKKFINKALEEFPELAHITYEVTEKLHGTNVQFHFEPGKEMRVASRNRYLEKQSKFYNVWDTLLDYAPLWAHVGREANRVGSIRLFAEMFGGGIQKGVNYGPKHRIRFFGLTVNNQLLPPTSLKEFADAYNFLNLLVPEVKLIEGLEAALAVDTNFPTMINPIEGNICEGIVIRPYHKVYRLSDGSTFMLKKKNLAFLEKTKAPKPKVPVDSEVVRLHDLFKAYIVKNRINNIFSNWGCIERPDQIGEYIRLVIQDAVESFAKDYNAEWESLSRKQRGQVTKVGGMVAKLLQEYL